MKTIRTIWSLPSVVAIALGAAVSAGCTQSTTAGGPADPSPGSTQQAQADNAGGAAMHAMHGQPGPEMLLFAALHHLDLTPGQRTTIENAAHGITPAPSAHQALLLDVAAGVRAGKLDEGALLAKLDAAVPPADRGASLAGAVDTLHATLSPEQRQKLVDMIGKHIEEAESSHGPAAATPQGLLDHLLAGVNLTTDQRAAIDRILASQAAGEDPAATSARIQAFHADLRARLQTFASDRFDAAAFVAPAKDMPPMGMREHVEHTLHALAAILPVLDATQRETLAAAIEAGPPHGH
ncbi:MAG TPA: hypothetical protein VF765_09905 [Polyangiaceae bacterium]